MKISLNWLKDYLDIDFPAAQISEMLTAIGLEVEGEETVESIKGGLEGLVIGFVKECGQHPNADRLSLTKVDVGGEEDLQIVCGAPNVAQGQKVVVATVGTILYDKEAQPFKIKKGKIRGEVSQGMICAEDEIGLSDDHGGIIVLPETVAIGTPASKYYKVENDTVFEIGLTPNRSDATAHIGVAKDLAAYLKVNHDLEGQVKMPDLLNYAKDDDELSIAVNVENTEACPRYAGVALMNVKVGDSPDWLKVRLQAIGVRPINNIVDITNFVLHEFGQPLHAFDASKIAGQKVVVKTLAEGTKFTTLDEQERKLSDQDLMICDGDGTPMCIAGVMGGTDSGVTETTKSIFLESAHFDAGWVRRTSTRHLLRTDAAICFEKGSDPNIVAEALKRAALLMKELAGATIASEITDIYPTVVEPKAIRVNYTRVRNLIGVEISAEDIQAILSAMEMELTDLDDTGLTAKVPTNKADVLREVDVIEEVLRIYGFNKVPLPTHIRTAVVASPPQNRQQLYNSIADQLSAAGFNEMMGLSLTESRYFREILPVDEERLVFVNNTSNVHLDVMRPTLLFSGLEAIVHNQNRKNADLKLYEFGKSYKTKESGEGFDEQAHLSLLISGKKQSERWNQDQKGPVSYFTLKSHVDNVLRKMGATGFQQTAVNDDTFAYALRYHRGQQILAEFGKVNPTITKAMNIKQEVFFGDIYWDNVLKAVKKHKISYTELNKYPSIRRDLALVLKNSVKFEEIVLLARKAGKQLLRDINLFDVYENEEQLGADKKSYAVSFTFEDPTKTLKDKEVEKIMNQLIQKYESELGAIVRR